MKKFFILYLILFTISFSKKGVYVLGVNELAPDYPTNSSTTFNNLLEDMIEKSLNIEVEIVEGPWEKLNKDFKDKKIDFLMLTPTEEKSNYASFTDTIIDQNLYLVSRDIELRVDKLQNKDIFVLKNSSLEDQLKGYLRENKIKANLLPISKTLAREKNAISLGVEKDLANYKYHLYVGRLPGMALGVQKEHKDFIPALNSAIEKKYKILMDDVFEKRIAHLTRESFYNSLTLEEKEYLANLKEVVVGIDIESRISYYSENLRKDIGSLTAVLEEIKKRTGLNIVIKRKRYLDWDLLFDDFHNNYLDLFVISKRTKINKKLDFTSEVDTATLHEIRRYGNKSNKIGTVKGTLSAILARDYFLDKNIVFYKDRFDLKEALEKNDIKGAFIVTYSNLDMSKYRVRSTEKVPIYLALPKNSNPILTSIMNKAISSIKDRGSIKKKAEAVVNYDEYLKGKAREHDLRVEKTIISIILVMALIFLLKLIYGIQASKRLMRDALTKLPNIFAFNKFKEGKKCGTMLSIKKVGYILAIDINSFKDINLKYGYDIGNDILLFVANTLREVFPNSNIFRVSGDEFCIFVNESSLDEYLKIMDEKIKSFNESNFLPIKLNVGYYLKEDSKMSMEESFNYASHAMYEVRKQEKKFYFEANDKFIKDLKIESSIKTLLMEENFSGIKALYQPKIDLKTKKIIGAESVSKWVDEKIGFISPRKFIPVAEKLKKIHLIDFKIAEEGIKIGKVIKELGISSKDFKISFNLSSETFRRENVVREIEGLLNKYNISGNYVEVEITEEILSDNINRNLKKFKEFKNLGVQIVLENFTGAFTTAALLGTLPVNTVKFNRAILFTLTEEKGSNKGICKNLITLAKNLNLKIVVEGIETPYQLNFLEKNRVDMGQGFLFSKALSNDNLINKLLEEKMEG